jgi:Fe-S oxidoreductase
MIFTLFFCVATAVVFGFFAFNVRKTWLRLAAVGQGAEENRSKNFWARIVPVITMGLGQKKMYKDFLPALMHLVIFWGFFVVSLGTVDTIVTGVFPSLSFIKVLGEDSLLAGAYLRSQDWGNFLVCSAVAIAVLRRLAFPPRRFQGLSAASRLDAYVVLLFIFFLVGSALVVMGADAAQDAASLGSSLVFAPLMAKLVASPWLLGGSAVPWGEISEVFWWVHIACLFSFMTYLPFSKHQHLIWVWPNIFYRNQHGSGRLRPMQFAEDAESFGVGKAEDFTWKQLLDGITCVECGRCTAVCPATATNKPLDPRKIVHHLKESFQDALAHPKLEERKELIGGIVTPDELWACTTCGACMEACPLEIEHIPAIIDMRRYLTMTAGSIAPELQTTLEKLESQGNPWGFNNATRADWAKGLGVPTMAESGKVDYLFWVGCAGSFDRRYQEVSKSFAKIMQKANVSFAILGSEERCNGDVARRAGNEYLADMQIKENIATLQGYEVKKIVTACPHCFNTFRNEYPDFGFQPEVMHHSQLISQLIADGKLPDNSVESKSDASSVVFHDPCYLGRHNKEFEAPRTVLRKSAAGVPKEMPRNKENSFCCGAGGARMFMEETIGQKINVARTEEALATGASTIATACPFCMTMVTDGLKSCGKDAEVKVQDIAEIVASGL